MNILNKVEDYLKYQSEVFGDDINTISISPVQNEDLPPVVEKDQQPERTVHIQSKQIESGTISKPSPNIVTQENNQGIIMTENVKPELTVAPNWNESESLEVLNSRIANCLECELGKERNKLVFGSGNENADIMVIGEAPGADEDEQGLPFVGRAGKLLTKMLEAIHIKREDIYIANICKCRPPGNRRPTSIEVDACEPYLKRQIEIIKPAFILSLGLTSVDTLLKKKHKMGDIRGSIMDYHGIDMLVTYHPAALLRNPNWKQSAWDDLKKLRMLYDKYLLTKKNQ